MYLCEKEAKTKICPLARNAPISDEMRKFCVGSLCMAWRSSGDIDPWSGEDKGRCGMVPI